MLVPAEAAELLVGRKCWWGRALVSGRTSAQSRAQRGSESFIHLELQLELTELPSWNSCAYTCRWMLFPKAMLWHNTAPNTLQKCTRAALTNTYYTCQVGPSSSIRTPQVSSGLCWHLEPLSALDFSGEKLRENKVASVLRELQPEWRVFHQTEVFLPCAHFGSR